MGGTSIGGKKMALAGGLASAAIASLYSAYSVTRTTDAPQNMPTPKTEQEKMSELFSLINGTKMPEGVSDHTRELIQNYQMGGPQLSLMYFSEGMMMSDLEVGSVRVLKLSQTEVCSSPDSRGIPLEYSIDRAFMTDGEKVVGFRHHTVNDRNFADWLTGNLGEMRPGQDGSMLLDMSNSTNVSLYKYVCLTRYSAPTGPGLPEISAEVSQKMDLLNDYAEVNKMEYGSLRGVSPDYLVDIVHPNRADIFQDDPRVYQPEDIQNVLGDYMTENGASFLQGASMIHTSDPVLDLFIKTATGLGTFVTVQYGLSQKSLGDAGYNARRAASALRSKAGGAMRFLKENLYSI